MNCKFGELNKLKDIFDELDKDLFDELDKLNCNFGELAELKDEADEFDKFNCKVDVLN